MNTLTLKKNDVVVVIKGKNKGKTGKILKVIPEKRRAIVEKINFVKEFIRPDRSKIRVCSKCETDLEKQK